MGALIGVGARLALALAAASSAAPAAARPAITRGASQIAEASTRFNIPESWIGRVMLAESGGQTLLDGRPITSRKGAMGLMQLMPGTWQAMRVAHGLGPDPFEPRDNILAGTAYLRAMYDRFGYPGLFAAYNAGPARFAEHLAGRRRLPSETRAYVAKVTGAGRPIVSVPIASGLFVAGADNPSSQRGSSGSQSRLFVTLSSTARGEERRRDRE